MIRVLWICNVILPDFCNEYGINVTKIGGWMTGMLSAFEKLTEFEVALAFPIRDPKRLKDGFYMGHPYFSFGNENNDVYITREDRKKRLKEIVKLYDPDVIHVWGTEYPWALEMAEICVSIGIIENVIFYIQGLVTVCAKYYLSGISDCYLSKSNELGETLQQEKDDFEKRGENEIDIIKLSRHICGRTDWDKAFCMATNPTSKYHCLKEVLRPEFYKATSSWRFEESIPHTIFVSQAGYPIKGFHLLLEALSIVIRYFPDTKVYVGGINIIAKRPISPYGALIYDMIIKYNLSNVIHFCGQLDVEDMIAYYKKCRVFVVPSILENSSNSTAEAMTVGIPVVASYVGGAVSYLKNKENCLTYPLLEIELLAHYIMECFLNRNLCDSISKGGVETARDMVSEKKGMDGLVVLYRSILNQ